MFGRGDDRPGLDGVPEAKRIRPRPGERRDTAAPPPPRAPQSGDRLSTGGILVIVFTALVALVVLEAALSNTSLITPLDPRLRWTMRSIGFVAGLALGILTVRKPHKPMNGCMMVGVVLITPLLVATGFEGIAWRMGDLWHFGLSRAPFAETNYPIEQVEFGTKGRRDTITIDPFDTGIDTHIPIPDEQYDELLGDTEGKCVRVMHRTAADGAVEIVTRGEYTWAEPERAVVKRCVSAWR